MSRVNDVGGVEGFGPVQREDAEPPFHADWEAHVFAMNRTLCVEKGVLTAEEVERALLAG
jgi:nitrile hydratase